MRADIEAEAGIDAVDIYGLSEVMGPGVASECVETKDGPVVWEDHFYAEIINPDTGEPVADGEPGELVFTSLTKEAMPIVRYRTRDLTRLLPPTARSMRRIGKITGRSDDMLIVRGVNMFPTQVEELVLNRPAGAALPAGAVAYRQYGRAGNPDRGARRVLDAVRRGPRGAGQAAAARGQDAHRRQRAHPGVGRGPCRAHADRQGAPRDRQASK